MARTAPWWAVPLAGRWIGYDPVVGKFVRFRKTIDLRAEQQSVIDISEAVTKQAKVEIQEAEQKQ